MSNQDDWRGMVEQVRPTGTARGRARSGWFSIEGIRLHERALRAGWQVESAFLGQSFGLAASSRIQTLIHDLEKVGCRLVTVPDEVMVELTGGRDLGAIIGLLQIPDPPALNDVVAGGTYGAPLLLVAADVKDPGNTGALMRTALAAGATAFVACGISDPYHPKALRTSMGSLFKLPVLTAANTEDLLAELSASGIQSIGLAIDGDVLLEEAGYAERGAAVLVGSEAWGLAAGTQNAVDCLVSIPMAEGVDSYSVNAAAAIALYELGRRRAVGQSGAEKRS